MAFDINDISPRDQYTATGGQTLFIISFEFLENSDIKAYLTLNGNDADDASNILTLTSDYSLVGAGTNGTKTLTLTAAASAGDVITIMRDDSVDRDTEFLSNGDLTIDAMNLELDKLTTLLQQIEMNQEQRTLMFYRCEQLASVSLALPKPVASTYLAWDSTGKRIVNAPENATITITNTDVSAIDNIAALRLITGLVANESIIVNGYYTPGDEGGGSFYWNATSSDADNAGTIIKPTAVSGAGRWLRIFDQAFNAKWFGCKLDATITGATLSGTDDSATLNAAISAANVLGVRKVEINGSIRLDAPVIVKSGVLLDGIIAGRPVWNNTTLTWENVSGTVAFINHGAGSSVDLWSSAAFTLNEASSFINIATVYPGQDMTTTGTPTTFPPTITIAPDSLKTQITDVNLVNAYSGIDAMRTHGNLVINNIYGYPVYRGIRIGSMQDNDTISRVHFNPLYTFGGSVTSVNSLIDWCFDNAVLLELGRNSYSHYENLFAYNYKATVEANYQAADVGNDIDNAGGTRESLFYNIRGDSCKHTMLFDSTATTGMQHYGISIYGLIGVSKSAYNPSVKKGVSVLTWLGNSTEKGGFQVFGGRANECDADVFKVTYSNKSEIHGYEWFDFAKSTAASVGVLLNNTNYFKIIGGAADLQAVAAARLVHIQSTNTFTRINGVSVNDHSGVIDIDNDSNSNYTITDNDFKASGTTVAINDSQHYEQSCIKNNNSESNFYILDNTDVDGSGILTIPDDEQHDGLLRYSGTSTINGITPWRKGREIRIRFAASSTVADDSGFATGAEVLRMAGPLSATTTDTLTLVHDTSAWYETSRSVN